MKDKIKILYGDICQTKVDAILCQTNTDLEAEDTITVKLMELGGDEVQAECNQFENLHKGKAVATTAGKLPSKMLIHTIICNTGEHTEEDEMMLAIRSALNLANEKMLKSLSMPLIGESTGIPIKRAAELMLAEVKRHLEGETSLEKVIFVLQDQAFYNALEEGFRQL